VSSEIDMTTFETLKEVSGADFIGELINTFLEDAPRLIAQMKSAIQGNDADGFRRAAHSFKSNSATFGANRLADQARELEMLGKENKLGQTGEGLARLEAIYKAAANELQGLQ
jgi:histidine phosphotransfer protein HptB